MSDSRIIEARYVDVRPIRTRKMLQIVLEIPIELAEQVTSKLGWPDPVNGTRCAVALLNDGAKELAGGTTLPHDGGKPGALESSGPPAKPNSTRAVMMAKDPEFWAYLTEEFNIITGNEAEGDARIKAYCGIRSKSELNAPGPAATKFERLRSEFKIWRAAHV